MTDFSPMRSYVLTANPSITFANSGFGDQRWSSLPRQLSRPDGQGETRECAVAEPQRTLPIMVVIVSLKRRDHFRNGRLIEPISRLIRNPSTSRDKATAPSHFQPEPTAAGGHNLQKWDLRRSLCSFGAKVRAACYRANPPAARTKTLGTPPHSATG